MNIYYRLRKIRLYKTTKIYYFYFNLSERSVDKLEKEGNKRPICFMPQTTITGYDTLNGDKLENRRTFEER